MMKPSPFPKTSPAGSEWKVTVRSGVVEESLKGLLPPTYRPRIRVATSSPSVMVNMSLSLMFSLRARREGNEQSQRQRHRKWYRLRTCNKDSKCSYADGQLRGRQDDPKGMCLTVCKRSHVFIAPRDVCSPQCRIFSIMQ